MSIEENEDVGFIWQPNTQFNPGNECVLDKTGAKNEQEEVEEPVQNDTCVRNERTVVKPDDEKLKHQKSVKLTDSENDFISMLMTAMGTKNAAEAIRRCVREMMKGHEEDVKRIAKRKERIGTL